MKLLKRWAIVLLIHASLTLGFLVLEWFIPFPEIQSPFIYLSSTNAPIGVVAVLLIDLLIGTVWGLMVSQDDRFKAVVLGYVVLLGAMLATVWFTPWGWMAYLTLHEPLGYFTRSMTQRTLLDQILLGLGVLSAPLGLWIGLRLGLRIQILEEAKRSKQKKLIDEM